MSGKNEYLAKWYASCEKKEYIDFRPTAEVYIRAVKELIPVMRDIEDIDSLIYRDPVRALHACHSFITKAIEAESEPQKAIQALAAFTFRIAAIHSPSNPGPVTEDRPHEADDQ